MHCGLISAARRRSSTPQPTSFSDVKLLLGFESSLNNESSISRTGTAVGNAAISTAQAKFGTHSLYLDGSGDALSFADSGDWDLGVVDITWEMWVMFDPTANLATTTYEFVTHYNTTSAQRAFRWGYSGASGACFFELSSDGVTATTVSLCSWSPSVSTWYHVAVCRSGTSFRQFVNGVQIGSTSTSSINDFNCSAPLRIGAHESAGSIVSSFKGWIDEVRFTKEALYIANFTPPVAPFPRS